MEYKYRVDVWRYQRIDTKFETNNIGDFCRYVVAVVTEKERNNDSGLDVWIDGRNLSYYEKMNYIKASQIIFGSPEYSSLENIWKDDEYMLKLYED